MKLKYKRQAWSGTYYATGESHRYAVDKPHSRWCLRVWTLPTLDTLSELITYDDSFTTMAAAKTAAQSFADEQDSTP